MNSRRIVLLTSVIVFAGWICSYGDQPAGVKPENVLIGGAGATFPEPLYKNWIDRYSKITSGVRITYEGVGSGEGINRFISNKVDFGASDSAMNDAEIGKVDRGVKLIPATAGIVVLAYNLPNLNGELKLPQSVYRDIFIGKIVRWNDSRIREANPGLNLPSREIILVARQDSSGTTFAFTNNLASIGNDWKNAGFGVSKLVNWPGNAMVLRGNEGVAGRIRISVGSIGYVEYGYAQRAGLPMAWLENKSGIFIKPSPESGSIALANAEQAMPENLRLFLPNPEGKNSYPIVTYSWLLLYKQYHDKIKSEALKKFVRWAITEGQQFSSELGYVPLPLGVRKRGEAALEEIH